MISEIVLPMYPGLAIGSIVPASKVLLPPYLKQHALLKEAYENAVAEKEAEKKRINAEKPANGQLRILELGAKVDETKADLDKLTAKIEALKAEKEDPLLEEVLPLDRNLTRTRIDHDAFYSETTDHIVFHSKGSSRVQVFNKIQGLVHKLLEGKSSTLIPQSDLVKMTQSVEELLSEDQSTTVTVLGSFICLTKVKTMEPLIIRQGTRLSKDLVGRGSKLYILSGAVLGAVFLGAAKDVSKVAKKGEQELFSNITSISCTTQGGLAHFPARLEEVNIWSVFTNWKNGLESNPNSGYPIGFRVRCLKEVLEENGVPTDKTHP